MLLALSVQNPLGRQILHTESSVLDNCATILKQLYNKL